MVHGGGFRVPSGSSRQHHQSSTSSQSDYNRRPHKMSRHNSRNVGRVRHGFGRHIAEHREQFHSRSNDDQSNENYVRNNNSAAVGVGSFLLGGLFGSLVSRRNADRIRVTQRPLPLGRRRLRTFASLRGWNYTRENSGEVATEGENEEDQNNSHFCGSCDCCCRVCCFSCSWFVRSLVFVIIGYIAAALLVSLCAKNQVETWTLNVGESRRFVPSSFVGRVHFGSAFNPNQQGVDVAVYKIPRKCPPLTGPVDYINDEHIMIFQLYDYQYDYFYLNAGSSLLATLTQSKGSTRVLLLQGDRFLAKLEGDQPDHDDWDEFRTDALASWFLKKGSGPKDISFRSQKNDVYILLYDNASNSIGKLEVSLDLELTTYNLNGYTPICADVINDGCVPISTKRSGCIIVDTTLSSSFGPGGEATVRIIGTRQQKQIFFLLLSPMVLLVILIVGRRLNRCCKYPVNSPGEGSLEPAREPLLNRASQTDASVRTLPTATPSTGNIHSTTLEQMTLAPPEPTASSTPPTREALLQASNEDAETGISTIQQARQGIQERQSEPAVIPLAAAEVILDVSPIDAAVGVSGMATIEVPIDHIDPLPVESKK